MYHTETDKYRNTWDKTVLDGSTAEQKTFIIRKPHTISNLVEKPFS